MRWWLAVAFALIAAVTAVTVAQFFAQRSERAFRERAEDLAVGASIAAADVVVRAAREGSLEQSVTAIAESRRLSVFVFGSDGALMTSSRSHRVDLSAVPGREEALESALAGQRYISSVEDGRLTVVALPLRGPTIAPVPVDLSAPAALLAYASRPELAAELGIVRDKIVEAALWAVLVGAVVGLLVAMLITARLRRIGAAAAAIEAGNFERPLRPRFRDELGVLGLTIDAMRERLRDSFGRLEAERDRLARLLERLQDGVVTVNRDLEVEFANEAARRLLGRRDLAMGDPLPDPWHELSLRQLAAGLFAPGARVAQTRLTPRDDRTYAVVGLPARRESETAILVLTDVSERERRERAEREFVTNAAHELRTPLAAITGAVEVLQQGAKETPVERDRFIAHIEREAARLGRLTKALLVLARAQTQQEAPRLSPVELAPLLREVAASLDPAEGVGVEVECPAGLAAHADRDLVEQALSNLAANAVKHTERGRVVLRARGARAAVLVEVVDTGPGMSPDELERMFDRFYRGGRRDADGFGLGLAIARQSVRALDGRIEVDSAPGRGTTVRMVLPAAGERAA